MFLKKHPTGLNQQKSGRITGEGEQYCFAARAMTAGQQTSRPTDQQTRRPADQQTSRPMTYKETIDFLYSQLPVYHRIGKAAYKANLDNTTALDDYFGNPHRSFRSVHIAGTNGKGSVSHMIASVLQEAGYLTALYTSPHLKDYRERIRINGSMIPESEVVSFVENNIEFLTRLKPSFFEMSVAMAFNWFARQKVDVAVIETGLGGRLDSTNIIQPMLSVITNIGYDHMDLLGDTLQKIAMEKAGIIKKGTAVIIGETSVETREIFIEKASSLHSEIIFADNLFNCTAGDFDHISGKRNFKLRSLKTGRTISGVSALGGDYQTKNIPVVAAVTGILGNRFAISEKHLLSGIGKVIENTGFLGRWQILGNDPLTICDTGHNKDGLSYVIQQLAGIKAQTTHIVIGFVNDKDLSNILPLFPRNAKYYFTRASVPRALDEKILMEKAAGWELKGKSWPTVASAFRAARINAGPDDLIFIGGSTFVVAEVV
jgi:dihydrofolate synthase / folylpolyglutamate synthase